MYYLTTFVILLNMKPVKVFNKIKNHSENKFINVSLFTYTRHSPARLPIFLYGKTIVITRLWKTSRESQTYTLPKEYERDLIWYNLELLFQKNAKRYEYFYTACTNYFHVSPPLTELERVESYWCGFWGMNKNPVGYMLYGGARLGRMIHGVGTKTCCTDRNMAESMAVRESFATFITIIYKCARYGWVCGMTERNVTLFSPVSLGKG